MADIAVSFAVDQLLPLLREEVNLLRGIHKEFAELKDELESIQAFLKDADKRATSKGDDKDEGVKIWVKQVREAAFRIEDIIDEYMIYVQQQQQPRDSGCVVSLGKITHLIKTLIPRHQIASEIQEIKSDVRGIKERSGRYDFQIQPCFEQGSSSTIESQNVKWHDPRTDSLYIEETELVGFEAPRDELIGWLLEGQTERTIISVVGMGGQGKTTLAKKVFDNKKVVDHFDCHAWITVSQSFTVEGLLRDLLCKFFKEKTIPQHIREMDRNALTEAVRDHLQEKRYVVVFDDVWHVEFWGKINSAVFNNKNGSRVIITTRNMGVANSCRSFSFVNMHELQPLTLEKSLELFNKNAFRFDFNGCCPEDLKDISYEIVKKCNGLPLAIVAIGGLLYAKKEKSRIEWEKFCHTLSSKLESDSHLNGITKILGFSYDDLPYYLKSCLLYFGVYPEDYEVKSKRLIRQWVAEGFVKKQRGETLEEVAETYLKELINRSLVQVTTFTINGKTKSCRVHDLLREMILKKFEDLSFCQHLNEDDDVLLSNRIVRRLSITTTSNDLLKSFEGPHTRSLLVFTGDKSLPMEFLQRIPKKYRWLKVLDFEDGGLNDFLPTSWGNLTHLKYLNLSSASMLSLTLPKFIGKLQNLETLDVRGGFVRVIPKEICKLKKLRHLRGGNMSLFQLINGIGGMTSLQTLREVELRSYDGIEGETLPIYDGAKLIEELGKLKQLREFHLKCVNEKHGGILSSSINEMQHLERLSIHSLGIQVIDLQDWISPSPMLQKLQLEGQLKKVPEWIPELHNLVKLTLNFSHLTQDPIKSLKNCPNLLYLHVGQQAYDGESLHFEDGGFKKLKELRLEVLLKLTSICIDRGALLSLKKFMINSVPKLKTVPFGIQHLEKLEVVDFSYVSKEFEQSIIPDGGQVNQIIQHVPLVKILHYSHQEGKKTHVIRHSSVQ